MRLVGPLLSAFLVLFLELLRDTPLRFANPPALFNLAIVLAGFCGGVRPALITAFISWAYTAYYFSGSGLFQYTGENFRRVIVWGLTMPLEAGLVGMLNGRAARARASMRVAALERAQAQERARAEEALRESEARFRVFVDHAADAFFLHDAEDLGKILDVNQQACQSLGYSREELIGHYPGEINPEMPPDAILRIRERVTSGETFGFITRHRRKDGSEFPVEIRMRPFQFGGKQYAVALARDITERRQAERALAESHDLLHAVVEGAADAIFLKDLQGRYRMINSAGARLLGKSVQEVIGRDDSELLPSEAARQIRARDAEVLASAGAVTFEETVPVPAGMRICLTTKAPYRDRQGKALGLIGHSRDITELKRLEDQFRQAQKMEALGRLAGGVAHDFNNLLTIITGYSELVFNRLAPEDPGRGPLAAIQKAGERAVALTRQLLAFSRKQVLQPQVLRLNPLLAELCNMLRRLIGEDVDIVLSLDPELGMAKVDPGQFEQAVINLAVNARDAMPGTGTLAIETRNVRLDQGYADRHPDVRPGDYVVVAVSDTGAGMDEATRSRIFEPFFTTKEAGKGTGLGLAMVYGFVKQTGGQIEVESERGRGSTFRLYLPRTEESPSEMRAAEEPGAPGGDETILLVEDDEAVRTLTRLMLQSCGYTVLEARDGQEGLSVAAQYDGPIHLLVTDLVMPRMGGRQLADDLQRQRNGMRTIFMSGHTDDAVLLRGEPGQGRAFLGKPFNPSALTRKVRQVLDG